MVSGTKSQLADSRHADPPGAACCHALYQGKRAYARLPLRTALRPFFRGGRGGKGLTISVSVTASN